MPGMMMNRTRMNGRDRDVNSFCKPPKTRAGLVPLLEGCTAISALGWPLNTEGPLEERLRLFNGVAGEVGDMPTVKPESFGLRMHSQHRTHSGPNMRTEFGLLSSLAAISWKRRCWPS